MSIKCDERRWVDSVNLWHILSEYITQRSVWSCCYNRPVMTCRKSEPPIILYNDNHQNPYKKLFHSIRLSISVAVKEYSGGGRGNHSAVLDWLFPVRTHIFLLFWNFHYQSNDVTLYHFPNRNQHQRYAKSRTDMAGFFSAWDPIS